MEQNWNFQTEFTGSLSRAQEHGLGWPAIGPSEELNPLFAFLGDPLRDFVCRGYYQGAQRQLVEGAEAFVASLIYMYRAVDFLPLLQQVALMCPSLPAPDLSQTTLTKHLVQVLYRFQAPTPLIAE